MTTAWHGDDYQRRFDELAASGADVHGEATFVRRFSPSSVLDAGCGTGRVAVELARHGIEVVGVDRDPSMLATARRRAPDLSWREADLTTFDLGRAFDVVVLAGNVPLFTTPGTVPALAAHCAAHVAPGGHLLAGFQLGHRVTLEEWDAAVADAGLVATDRFATWDGAAFVTGGDYVVAVHRRPA